MTFEIAADLAIRLPRSMIGLGLIVAIVLITVTAVAARRGQRSQ